ncbi:DUF1292 domain-containing protein [Fusibacter ferrireducens]|uniref:DUF1292 domain-containing protein n=1 Tax=Fusibacter ferrireducens TaxID=2785058 RepID=A0ABR9ZT90_9FIRM|nr:DUF1292 domain-containing protein [Fusibacter ferrireducens]MBF4693699.1 DUF1292 domain-containing protein [Fusibacter ferrireducens]
MKKEENLFEVVDTHDHGHEDVVELFDENGKAVKFNIIATLELDEQEYAILSNVEDEDEVLIFKVTEEDAEFVFETISDEEELESVIQAYNELMDEMDGEEDEE